MAATIWIRGETGLLAFSDPLPPGIAARLGKDLFREDGPDGDLEEEKPAAPARSPAPAAVPQRAPAGGGA